MCACVRVCARVDALADTHCPGEQPSTKAERRGSGRAIGSSPFLREAWLADTVAYDGSITWGHLRGNFVDRDVLDRCVEVQEAEVVGAACGPHHGDAFSEFIARTHLRRTAEQREGVNQDSDTQPYAHASIRIHAAPHRYGCCRPRQDIGRARWQGGRPGWRARFSPVV